MSLHAMDAPVRRRRIEQTIARAAAGPCDAILLGFGLCGYALEGLAAVSCRLVVPRVHDCIGLFFGGERRLDEYLRENPGTYFRTAGWLEDLRRPNDVRRFPGAKDTHVGLRYDEYAVRYGEDNARHLFEILGQPTRHYSRLAYVRTGTASDAPLERQAREEAERRAWSFETVEGDPSALGRFLAGDWREEEFLVVEPGHRIVATHDERVMDTVPDTGRG